MNESEQAGAAVAIRPGQNRSFDFDLEVRDFLHVTVEQRGIDVALSLTGPGGEHVVEIDSPVGAHGVEELVAIAAVAGVHRLEVRAPGGAAEPGEIVLRASEQRPAGERERALVEADGAYREGRALLRGGDRNPGIERLEAALEVFQGRSWGGREALALDVLAASYEETGALKRAAGACEAASDLYRDNGNAHMMPLLLERAGWLRLRLGQAAEAVERLSRAIELLPSETPPGRRVEMLIHLGSAQRAAGDFRRADETLERIRATAGGSGAEFARGRILSNHGLFLLGEQQPAAALDAFGEAVEVLRRHGADGLLAAALSGLAAAALEAGELSRGRTAVGEALARVERLGDRRQRAAVLNTLGSLERRAGDLAAARTAYDEALTLAREVGDRSTEAAVLLGLGYLDGRQQVPERGLARIDRARELFSELGDDQRDRVARVRAAEALRDLGRLGEARDRLAPVLEILEGQPIESLERAPAGTSDLGLRLEHLDIVIDVLRRLGGGDAERASRLEELRSRRSGI